VRVLYVIDSLDRPGGAEQALAVMAPHLVAAGVDLDVAYLIERDGFQQEIRDAGARVFPLLEPTRRRRAAAVARLVRANRVDLVHTTLFEADLAGRAGATLARTPVVSSLVNASYGPEHRGAPELSAGKVRAAQLADIASARLVRRFHALTDHVASVMSRRLLVRSSRIEVVPRGRSSTTLGVRSPERSALVRAGLGLPADAPVLVAAARHEHQKGLDVLVAAFADVRRDWPAARLVIAGREGTSTDRLRRLAEEGGVTDAVHLLGARTDVPDLVAAADVFVAPSRWEGLGSAVVEAMGIGTPIVASDVPAIRETVTTAGALLVPPDDPHALARALRSSLDDPDASGRRSASALARFRTRYEIETVTAAMTAFYDHALGTTGTGF
jgi:glycosyltransferase involved in cell wall biosynthesis